MDGEQFRGKVALVTGGGSGIGRAVALAFAQRGASVVIADIDAAHGLQMQHAIEQMGGAAAFIATDVAADGAVKQLLENIVQRYGRLDYACNNAGVEGATAALADVEERDWDKTIGVDLKGVWLCMKYQCRQMLQQGQGAIVNIASIMGQVGAPGIAPYVAAKHGVIGLTRAGALDYAKQGLRINAVCPGGIYTPIIERALQHIPAVVDALKNATPQGDLGQPEDIANAVLWLCSNEAKFITGQTLVVDGGYVAQ